jgi:hypothetical protein
MVLRMGGRMHQLQLQFPAEIVGKWSMERHYLLVLKHLSGNGSTDISFEQRPLFQAKFGIQLPRHIST